MNFNIIIKPVKYIIFLLLLANNSFAQVMYDAAFNQQDNWQQGNKLYVGNVKKVSISYYSNHALIEGTQAKVDSLEKNNSIPILYQIDSFSSNGLTIWASLKLSNQNFRKTEYFKYDENNNLIYNLSVNTKNDSVIIEKEYTYNEKKQVIKCKSYKNKNLGGEIDFTYNKNGKIETEEEIGSNYNLKKIKYQDNKKTIINYDINGNKTMKNEFSEDDTSKTSHFYSYIKNNAAGKEGITKYYKKALNIFFTFFRIYDYKPEISDTKTIETKYDEHKNLTKLVICDQINKRTYLYNIAYKYDFVGNIVEKIIIYPNGKMQKSSYEFEYY